MPFYPHRLRQFRAAIGRSPHEMARLIGLEQDTYLLLERGARTMDTLQQESFISRFGSELYSYIHGEVDRVVYEGKTLRREHALGDVLGRVTGDEVALPIDKVDLDTLVNKYQEAQEREKDRIYKKLLLAYKSLEADNQKLRSENTQLKEALLEAKDMVIKKFLKKE